MTWGKWYWPAFLITSAIWLIIGFGIPETIALITKIGLHNDDTLTNYARLELHVTSTIQDIHDTAWYLTLIVWLGLTTWLTGHIWFDLWGLSHSIPIAPDIRYQWYIRGYTIAYTRKNTIHS